MSPKHAIVQFDKEISHSINDGTNSGTQELSDTNIAAMCGEEAFTIVGDPSKSSSLNAVFCVCRIWSYHELESSSFVS